VPASVAPLDVTLLAEPVAVAGGQAAVKNVTSEPFVVPLALVPVAWKW